MPELPDLQAFSRNLTKELVGKDLVEFKAVYRKKLKTAEKDFKEKLEGARLASVYRDGKELRFAFDNGHVLGLHLMLKGQLRLFKGKNNEKYPIVEMIFNDGTGLTMTDWQGQANPALDPEPRAAPDALAKTVNFKFLKETLGRSKAAIKKLLTDQDIIRGIGNAYVDEILWDARISPFSVSNKIPDQAIKALLKSMRSVLKGAEKKILKAHPDIISGEVREFLVIHNATREQSPDGAKIRFDKTAGRKTYYTMEQKLYR